MPSPTTRLLDDFNRANGALGSNWTQAISAYAMPNIVSNAMDWPQFPSAAWATQFAANQEVWVEFTAGIPHFLLRMQNLNTATRSGYRVYGDNSGAFPAEAFRLDADGSSTSLGFSNGIMSASDTHQWVSMVGSVIRLYGSSDGTAWTLRQTWSDATYDRAGYIGVVNPNNGSPGALDNFGGGELGGPVLPAVSKIRSRGGSW